MVFGIAIIARLQFHISVTAFIKQFMQAMQKNKNKTKNHSSITYFSEFYLLKSNKEMLD